MLHIFYAYLFHYVSVISLYQLSFIYIHDSVHIGHAFSIPSFLSNNVFCSICPYAATIPLFLLYSISFSLHLYSQLLSSSFLSFHLFPLPLASAFYLLPPSFNPILRFHPHFYFLFSYQFTPSTLPKISPFLLFLSSFSFLFLLFVILAARFGC